MILNHKGFSALVKCGILVALVAWLGGLAGPSPAVASDQIPAPPQAKPIALVGGTLHTLTHGTIENGTLLFDKGKIVAVGTQVEVPADAIKVDISGKHVYPSLIESNSTLGLTEINAVRATRDFAETGSINPNVRAEVAINPDSEHFPVTRANGVGLAVTHPLGGLIAGKAAFIQLDGWTWEDMTLKAPVGMVLNWPRMTVISAWWMRQTPEQQKKQIKKNLKTLEKAFKDAMAYKVAREAAHQKGVPFHEVDERWEAMIPVLNGELPVYVNANEIKQILAAVDFADRWKLKMVLVGGADADRAIDLLKRKNIP
ncbi:MAG: amidohydrolase, partial [Calditrichaeota bacterium]